MKLFMACGRSGAPTSSIQASTDSQPKGRGVVVLYSRVILIALIWLSGDVLAADPATPPTVLAVDPAAESAVVAVPGAAPQILALNDKDPSEVWRLVSVASDSAQFAILKRKKYQPHRVRVFVKASGRAPLGVQDQVKIEPVPRMILTPVETLSQSDDSAAKGATKRQERPL